MKIIGICKDKNWMSFYFSHLDKNFVRFVRNKVCQIVLGVLQSLLLL